MLRPPRPKDKLRERLLRERNGPGHPPKTGFPGRKTPAVCDARRLRGAADGSPPNRTTASGRAFDRTADDFSVSRQSNFQSADSQPFNWPDKNVAGGFAPALKRPTARRQADWYRDYVEALIQRDVRDMVRIRSLDILPRLLGAAASQTARLFNLADLAAPFQVSRPTIGDYVTLLERLFLLERLPSWHSNRLSRLVKSPKLHVADAGLAAALLGADTGVLKADRTLLGQLLETFVFQELRRQASWHDAPTAFFHFRDKDGVEVDIVVERGPRAVAGVEVKAAATVTRTDFRGLRKATGLDEGSRAIAIGSERAIDPETFERAAGRPWEEVRG